MHLFLLPKEEQSLLCTMQNKKILLIQELSFPWDAVHTLSTHYLAFAVRKRKKIHVYVYFREKTTDKFRLFAQAYLHQVSAVKCLIINKGVLYIGGRDGHPLFYAILMEGRLVCKKMKIPAYVNKSIDAFVIHNNYLIVVDNVVYPKWILVYQMRNTYSPIFKKVISLPARSYESIRQAVSFKEHLVILSYSTNRSGSYQHIQTYDIDEVLKKTEVSDFGEEYSRIRTTSHSTWNKSEENERSHSLWCSQIYSYVDGVILLLKEKGLAKISFDASNEITRLNSFSNDRVLNVYTFADTEECIVIVERGDKKDAVYVERLD